MGWDDNGLPTERRVQNYFGVRCDPSLPYDADFTPPEKPDPKKQVPISRPNFIELCERLVEEDEKVFESLWRTLGLSVDWKQTYTTIGAKSQTASQRAFLRNFARGEAYLQESPTLWDVTFQTAVAQAELEAREYAGAYHRVAFHRRRRRAGLHRDHPPRADPGGGRADRAPRRRALPGRCSARPSPRRCSASRSRCWRTAPAEPDKGAGIAMCCTFGDLTDVHLVARAAAARSARSSAATAGCTARRRSGSRTSPPRRRTPSWPARPPSAPARRWSRRCASRGDLDGEPKPTQRMTNFYEKGDKPLEIVSTRQWYIKQRRPRRRAARRADRARRRDPAGSRRTCSTATTTGSTASTATG